MKLGKVQKIEYNPRTCHASSHRLANNFAMSSRSHPVKGASPTLRRTISRCFARLNFRFFLFLASPNPHLLADVLKDFLFYFIGSKSRRDVELCLHNIKFDILNSRNIKKKKQKNKNKKINIYRLIMCYGYDIPSMPPINYIVTYQSTGAGQGPTPVQ
jgi:hypothetical protein